MTSWQEFIASLVKSTAWPIVVLIAVALMRRPLLELLGKVQEVTYGGVKASFDKQIAEVVKETSSERPAAGISAGIDSSLVELSEISPRAAVLEAWIKIEAIIRAAVSKNDQSADKLHGASLIRRAAELELISGKLTDSLMGSLQLRNLAAHVSGHELDAKRAKEFLVLAEVNEFLLRQELTNKNSTGNDAAS